MCNCGKKRNEFIQQTNSSFKQNQNINIQPANAQSATMFKYTGNSGLTVIGNITRRNYRFNFPGDVQFIEPADVAGMLTVPVLRRIS